MQHYYAVDLQTDDKGRMTPYLLLECMSKLSFLYNYALFFFFHALLLHRHLGKNKNEKLDLHLCDQVITLIVVGIILLFRLFLKLQTIDFDNYQ